MEGANRLEEAKKREERIKQNLSKIKHKLVVISGKGGVGKTTVAINLACGLVNKGFKVGVLDIDFHGPNVPKMLGVEGKQPLVSNSILEPVEAIPGLKVMSLALLSNNPDQPVIWRGPLKNVAIKQLLGDVNWGELDFLVIDSPPGTGDEPLGVFQTISGLDGTIIVTTPQEVALMDARKAIGFSRELNVPVVGVIENMSGLICPHCGKEIQLFKAGGGEKLSREFKVTFLGRIPLDPEIVENSDSGKLSCLGDSRTSKFIQEVVDNILKRVL